MEADVSVGRKRSPPSEPNSSFEASSGENPIDDISGKLGEGEAGHQLERSFERVEATRVGRPPMTPQAGQRVSLGLKVTPEVKTRLDLAARHTGRTQSQEAELRLERSFEREDLLSEVLALHFGRQLAGILIAVGLGMDGAGRLKQTNPFERDWMDKRDRFDHAFRAAVALLDAMRPAGPVPANHKDARDPGVWFAEQLINLP